MWWISELLVECWIRSGGETCKLNRVSRHGKGENARFFIDIWKMCFLKLCQKLFPFTHSAHTYMDIEMIRDECYDICVQNLLTHRCNSFVPCHLIVHSTSVSLQQVPRCLCVRASVCVYFQRKIDSISSVWLVLTTPEEILLDLVIFLVKTNYLSVFLSNKSCSSHSKWLF